MASVPALKFSSTMSARRASACTMRWPSACCEIDGDRPLAAVDGEEIAGVAGVAAGFVLEERRSPAAGIVAGAGTFHLHHVGAEIGEDLSGPRARHDAAQIEHADMRQRTGHVSVRPADDQTARSLSASAIQAPP